MVRIKKGGVGGARPGAGKPPSIVPTDQQRHIVALLAAFERPQAEIASLIVSEKTKKPISVDVLRRAFADELASGPAKFAAAVARSAYHLLEKNNVPMTIFALKQRALAGPITSTTRIWDGSPLTRRTSPFNLLVRRKG
jgi:hypothetical protein